MVGSTVSHYRILEKLGEGGMGVVYKAEDLQLKRFVALKCLPHGLKSHEPEQARFLQEAQAVAALNHPNICTIHEFFSNGDEQFIVMEYVEGETLREKIQEGGKWQVASGGESGTRDRGPGASQDQVIGHAIQIAEALGEAHCHGIVHRDVKPDNIMVNSKNQIKVMDFGLAKLKGSLKLTKASSTVGTLAYMAPEQIQGEEVDARSDIFSFGIVFYEMLTGHLPFRGEHEAARIYSILNDEPEPIQRYLPEAPTELVHILSRALEKDPSVRYQTMQDLLIDLRRLKKDSTRVVRSSPESSTTRPPLSPAGLRRPSKRTIGIGIGGALVLIAVIGWFVFAPGKRAVAPEGAKSIAVMYFDNRTEEKDLDKVLVDMLITNLGRNRDISVVSGQRLYDILKSLGKQDLPAIDQSTATDIATRAGAKTMLLGKIWKLGDKLSYTGQLLDVESGAVINSDHIEANKADEVFAVADRLTGKVNEWLKGSAAETVKIADATTKSYEAYKFYEQGLRHSYRFEWGDAITNFAKAVETDSTFAMAYYNLSKSQAGLEFFNPFLSPNLLAGRESSAKAVRYSKDLPEKDRDILATWNLFLSRDYRAAREASTTLISKFPKEKEPWFLYTLGTMAEARYDESVRADEKIIAIEPSDPNTYNDLAYAYIGMHSFEKACNAIRTYMSLIPDTKNAYDSGWEVFCIAGRFDEALKIADEGLQRFPDHPYLRYKAETYLLMDQPDIGYELLAATGAPVERIRSVFLCFEGRFVEAIESFRRLATENQQKGNPDGERLVRFRLARAYLEKKEYDKALEELGKVSQLSVKIWNNQSNSWPVACDYYAGLALARSGKYAEATAKVSAIRTAVHDRIQDPHFLLFAAGLAGEISLLQKDPHRALADPEECIPLIRLHFPRIRMLAARANLELGNGKTALESYEGFRNLMNARYGIFGGEYFDFWLEQSKLDYYVGLAYEQMGEKAQAISSYQKALKRWKRADPDFLPAVDARRRLAGLLK